MLRLYVLRHAKSSWANPGQSDFDRGLNERGTSDLPKIATAIEQKGYIPDFIYCSGANRTQLTASGIVSGISAKPKISHLREMYTGGLSGYMEIIQNHPAPQALMIIGHNPTCHALATSLTGFGDEAHKSAMFIKYPTGALAVLDLPFENWADIEERSGTLVDYQVPRELA